MRNVWIAAVFLVLCFCTAGVCALPRYVFLFIGDGLGREAITLYETIVPSSSFSRFPVFTLLGNRTAEGKIPDSASSATSIACGVKVPEGFVAMDGAGRPLETIAEKAKKKGFSIGILTSVAINDATPAAFYAHAPSRKHTKDIAWQMVASGFDLFVGSGIITAKASERDELLHHAKKKGYRIVSDVAAFLRLQETPAIVLLPFTFALDRKASSPTLALCVRKAIELLEPSSRFFLIVEGGRIDWCNHMNDTVASLKELEDFDAAIQEALSFVQKHPDETLILVTADHETGGLTWDRRTPFLLPFQRGSYDRFLSELRNLPKERTSLQAFIASFWEGENIQGTERQVADFLRSQDAKALWIALSRSLAERRRISWTTTGHTAAPVPLYAWGKEAFRFAHAEDNTDIATILAEVLVEDVVPKVVF